MTDHRALNRQRREQQVDGGVEGDAPRQMNQRTVLQERRVERGEGLVAHGRHRSQERPKHTAVARRRLGDGGDRDAAGQFAHPAQARLERAVDEHQLRCGMGHTVRRQLLVECGHLARGHVAVGNGREALDAGVLPGLVLHAGEAQLLEATEPPLAQRRQPRSLVGTLTPCRVGAPEAVDGVGVGLHQALAAAPRANA